MMTDHLTELRDRHAEQAELMRAVGLSRPEFYQNTADALTALIEAREAMVLAREQIVRMGGDGLASGLDAAIAFIDALGKETQVE